MNLKAELDIMLLHEKIDLLRDKQWQELLDIQRQQLAILQRQPAAPNGAPAPSTT